MTALRFTKDHEWVRRDGEVAVIGITDYAQAQLGDVVYVELPEIGRRVEQGKEAAVVESAKAASEVYAPVSGEVVAVNDALAGDPAKVNADPMGEGWFLKLRLADPGQLDALMDEAGLPALCRGAALMRYLPLTDADRRAMLAAIGVASIDELFADVPPAARLEGLVDLPLAQGEIEVERAIGRMAAKNVAAGSVPFFLGGGAYRHHVPAAVDHLIQRGEFLTSYTPYQPEMAQGTLQYLFEFQTQVALLTGMEVANASLYDGADRLRRGGDDGEPRHPPPTRGAVGRAAPALPRGLRDLRAVCRVRTGRAGPDARRRRGSRTRWSMATPPASSCRTRISSASCATSRRLAQPATRRARCWSSSSPRSCRWARSRPPGEMGADIVAAEGQSLGNALNFGGPYLGLFASREKFVRQMPGRLVGETVDAEGRRGWVLTLSTREQHIRREKATSNICTNSGLCALAFTIHLALLGEAGLARGWRGSTTPRRCASPSGSNGVPRVSAGQRQLLQRIHLAPAVPGGAGRRGAGGTGRARRRPGQPASIPSGRSSPICCWSPRPRP